MQRHSHFLDQSRSKRRQRASTGPLMNMELHHGVGSYDPGYYRPPNHLYPQPPTPHSQAYYPPTSAAPPPPQTPQDFHHASSDTGSSPYHTSYTDHTNSSSFESHGSSHSHGGVPPYVGVNPASHYSRDPAAPSDHPPPHSYPMMMMGPPAPLHGYHPGYPWPPPAPIQYFNNVRPTDVLSGRGGATNTHSGNRAFRALVKQFQERYLKAKKRDKPSVAVEVVHLIRKKGGRFLRRCGIPGPQREVLYYDIGDRRATEKACQALREGAPVLRAKRRGKDATTSSEDERCASSESSPPDQSDSLQATSTFDQPAEEENKENTEENAKSTKQNDNSSVACERPEPEKKKEPFLIRPSAWLMRRASMHPISLDELSQGERDTYLREFLPPNPTCQANEKQQNPSATLPSQNCKQGGDSWPVVSV